MYCIMTRWIPANLYGFPLKAAQRLENDGMSRSAPAEPFYQATVSSPFSADTTSQSPSPSTSIAKTE